MLDRYSNVLMSNPAALQLLSALVDPSLLAGTPNILRMTFHPLGIRRVIVNWDEVSRHLLARAERELAHVEEDAVGLALLDELRGFAGPSVREPPPAPLRAADLLLPVHIRHGGLELKMFSTIMTLGTPQDVTLQELRLETFFPADEESAARLRGFTVQQ